MALFLTKQVHFFIILNPDFDKDLEDLMQDSIAKDESPDGTAIELEGMRLSHNASFAECIRICAPLLFNELKKKKTTSVQEFVAEMKRV